MGAVERDREQVLAVVDRADLQARLRTPAGTMTVVGYLPTRLFELTVHTADLARATGQPVPPALEPAWGFALHLVADLALRRGAGVVVTEALTGRGPLSAGFTVL